LSYNTYVTDRQTTDRWIQPTLYHKRDRYYGRLKIIHLSVHRPA